jgi:hypothetical protein
MSLSLDRGRLFPLPFDYHRHELMFGTVGHCVVFRVARTHVLMQHYAPWCAARDDHHIQEVMKNRK